MPELLNDMELGKALGGLPNWKKNGGALSRTVELASFPQAIEVVNRVAAIAASRSRSWWLRTVPITVTAVTLLVAGVVFFVDSVWRPFPDELPPTVTVWVGVAVLALAFAVIRCATLGWRGRTAALLAAG